MYCRSHLPCPVLRESVVVREISSGASLYVSIYMCIGIVYNTPVHVYTCMCTDIYIVLYMIKIWGALKSVEWGKMYCQILDVYSFAAQYDFSMYVYVQYTQGQFSQ